MRKAALFISLALALTVCSQVWAQDKTNGGSPAMTFEEALAKVGAYEVGVPRTALVELGRFVMAASSSPEMAKAMERALIKALEGQATLEGKDQICRHLSVIGSAAAVPPLARMLDSPDTADMARYALERIPEASVGRALLEMLPKTSGKVKTGIVNTLGRRKDNAAVAALCSLMQDDDLATATAAAAALGRIADPAAINGLAAVRVKASGALRAEIDEAYLRCAEHMMGIGNHHDAFAIFKDLNAPSEPELIRIGALRGLAISGGKAALPMLGAALKASESRVQAQAIRQLSSIPGAEVTAVLAGALAGNSTLNKIRILTALADRGDKGAVPVLLTSSKDNALPVRIAALQGLGRIGDASLALLLAGTAAKDSPLTESMTTHDQASARTGGLPPPVADATEQTAAQESLYSLRGADVDKAIIAGIGTAESKAKVELIKAASERGISAATDTLLQTVKDTDPEVRRTAFRALGRTARSSNLPALIDLLATTQAASDRQEASQAIASVLRRSDASAFNHVQSASESAANEELRMALQAILAQAGKNESLPPARKQ